MSSRILIIDACQQAGRFLADALELDGYAVELAYSAAAGLSRAVAAPPDLILLDYVLPDMDGAELLLTLKATDATRDSALVMIAQSDRDDKVVMAIELGATDFVPKPFSAPVVRARVRHALRIRNLQLRMRRQKETAEYATAQKAAFLANVSHEIRTPMTAILGFSDVLYFECDQATAPRQQIDAIRRIKRNAEYLLELINDILDLAKIEAGKVEVCRHRCSAIQVVGEVVSLLRMRAEEKQLALHVQFDGPQPETAHTDPTRLRQILINLVSNAVKFTERGTVSIRVSLLDRDTDEPRLRFEVTDTGIGISPAEAARLFRQYSQASPYTSRQYGGTGLGLAISKQLAEMLGGTITLNSEVGRGSTFTLTIATGSLEGVALLEGVTEAELVDETELFGPPPSRNILSGRVLLAEDGPDNQRLLKHVLETAGAAVTVAENGQLAVAWALAAWERGEPYDVVLMDMHMPVLDGHDATVQLRRAAYPGAIIALTALAMEGDRQRCLDAGCDAYASKPINRRQLVELVGEFCGSMTSDSVPAQQPAPLASEPRRRSPYLA